MAEAPKPSPFNAPIKAPPKAPPVSYVSNGTIGRVCTMQHPMGERRPTQYLSQGPTPAQMHARREAQRKQMNTVGLWMCGIPCGGGALVRLLGGSEDAVESAAKMGWETVSPFHTPK